MIMSETQPLVSMRALFEAGVHFGHRTRYRNPRMSPYIHGVRSGVNIINLDKTLPRLKEALAAVSKVAAQNGKVLFVGTKRPAQELIAEHATRCGMPYVNHRWLGGTLTNYKTVKKSIRHFQDLEAMQQSGELDRMTKKEGLTITRKTEKMNKVLCGLKNIGGLPDLLLVIDVGHERIAIKEANRLTIPVIGIVDTNHDPEGIDYCIPGNDDSTSAIGLYLSYFSQAIIDAKEAQKTTSGHYEEYVEELESVMETPAGENLS